MNVSCKAFQTQCLEYISWFEWRKILAWTSELIWKAVQTQWIWKAIYNMIWRTNIGLNKGTNMEGCPNTMFRTYIFGLSGEQILDWTSESIWKAVQTQCLEHIF